MTKILHCKTGNASAKEEKVLSCQAVVNGLQLENVPEELDCLNTLEVILIAKRLLCKKSFIISKRQTPKTHGSIVNVPVNVSESCTQLPREGSCEGVILVKLKKKFSFKGHLLFEPVRPHRVRATLEYLLRVNPLYYSLIRDSDINQDLLAVGNNLPDNNIDLHVESGNELECTTNPLSAYPLSAHRHKDVEGLNYFERCNLLNSNAVLLACHFQHRVEIFF